MEDVGGGACVLYCRVYSWGVIVCIIGIVNSENCSWSIYFSEILICCMIEVIYWDFNTLKFSGILMCV